MICLTPSSETHTRTQLRGAWVAVWCVAQLCLVLASVALLSLAPPRSQPRAPATQSEPQGSSASALTPKPASPAPEPRVAARPATLERTPDDNPVFYAALHVGEAWLVLYRLAPSERSAPATAASVRAVPLTQGEAVLLTPLGPPAHLGYTLVAGDEICSTRALGQVRLELDSGDPGDHSALGPAWIADELAPCSLSHEPRTPFVAIAGKSQAYPAPTLSPLPVAQRVKFDAAANNACEGNDEVVEAQLEIAGRQFSVKRVSGDPDALSVVELGGTVVLSTRAALTWDSVGAGC